MDGATGTTTFLLTDIEGSTRHWEAAESQMRQALARHDAILTDRIDAHAGRVLTERGEGDSFFALFPAASDAVAAALDIQRALGAEPWPTGSPIRVRMAIHTGEAGPDHRGPEVNRCARLRAIAHGSQVLLSAPTATLVRGRLPAGAGLDDLGLHRLRDLTIPERVFQLVHADIAGDFPALASLDAFRHNLPIQVTSFVGRAAELATVIGLLEEHRLVTLIGAGGAGKTRLALQVGAELLETYPDGVWFTDLGPLADTELVPATVAASAGVPEMPGRPLVQTLAEHLADTHTLLVIDNCEHLVGAVADLVDKVLRGAAGVRVLATSREGLAVPGEHVWRVPSLSLPDGMTPLRAETAPRYEAVQLFRDRAVAAQSRFALTDENADVIGHICRRLDGVPLAIELAAARTKMLAPDELLRRLEDRFRVLTGGSRTALPRQQTLRAAVDWSHDLLGEPERILFRRLAVFAGGFDLAAAEAVCGAEPVALEDVLELLAGLVDKSLAIAEPDESGDVRYVVLETLRQYARERLETAGEVDAIADAHLRHYLEVAERAHEGRFEGGAAGPPALAILERELENLRVALDRARATDPDLELQLAGALGWFWPLHTEHASEGRARLAHSLAGRETERTSAVARALSGAALTASWAGDATEAAALAERAISIWHDLGDDLEMGIAFEALGWARFFSGDDSGALEPMRESVAHMERTGDRRLINRVTVALGQVLVALGDVEETEALAYRTLEVGREIGAPRDIHYSLHYLGDCAMFRDDGDDALDLYGQSFAAALDYGNVAEAAIEMEGFAMALATQGRREASLRLKGAAAAKMEAVGLDVSGVVFWNRLKQRYLGGAAEAVGPTAAAALEAEGRAMGWDAAVASIRSLSPTGERTTPG